MVSLWLIAVEFVVGCCRKFVGLAFGRSHLQSRERDCWNEMCVPKGTNPKTVTRIWTASFYGRGMEGRNCNINRNRQGYIWRLASNNCSIILYQMAEYAAPVMSQM